MIGTDTTVRDLGPEFLRNGMNLVTLLFAILCPSNSIVWVMYGSFFNITIELSYLLMWLSGAPLATSFFRAGLALLSGLVVFANMDADLTSSYRSGPHLTFGRICEELRSKAAVALVLLAAGLYDCLFALFDPDAPILSALNLVSIAMGAFAVPLIEIVLVEPFLRLVFAPIVMGDLEKQMPDILINAITFWLVSLYLLMGFGFCAISL